MKKISFHSNILLVTTLVTLIFFLIFFVSLFCFTTTRQEEKRACTEETRVCPDGSSVGRTGPNCTFAPCLNDSLPNHPGITEEPLEVPALPEDKLSRIKKEAVCTQEVKTCPDGSFVTKTSPQCEFAPCPSDLELDNNR